MAAVALIALILIGFFVLSGYGDKPSSGNSNQSTIVNTSSTSSPTASTGNKLVFKDLGVEITLPGSLMGTTYNVVKPENSKNAQYTVPPMINLELKQYSTLVIKCLGGKANGDYPYAGLSKVAGKAPATDDRVLRQFNTFYIDKLFDGPNPKCQNTTDQQALDSLAKTLSDGLQSAFAGAQQI